MCVCVYLLCVSLSEGQLGGHVKHDLLLPVDSIDRLGACLTVGHIQTPTEPAQENKGGDQDFLVGF